MVDYFSFDDVINELNVSEEDLKRMVSEGEIRAFRSDNKMKFRKEDVENLRKGKTTEPTIILPPSDVAEAEDSGADVGLDLDIDSEALTVEAPAPKPKSETKPPVKPRSETKPAVRPKSERVSAMPSTRPKSETVPALDLDLAPEPEPEIAVESAEEGSSVDDINLDDLKVADETATEPEETFIEEGGEEDSGAVTAPLALADESGEETVDADTGEITDEGLEAEADTTAPRGRSMRRGRTGGTAPVAAPGPQVGILWVIILFLGFIPTLGAAVFSADYLTVEAGVREYPSAVTNAFYDIVLDHAFIGLGGKWKDGEWTSRVQQFQSPPPPWTVSIPSTNDPKNPVTLTFGVKHTGATYRTPDLGGPAPATPAGP